MALSLYKMPFIIFSRYFQVGDTNRLVLYTGNKEKRMNIRHKVDKFTRI